MAAEVKDIEVGAYSVSVYNEIYETYEMEKQDLEVLVQCQL